VTRKSNIVKLSDRREQQEWQRIMPLLELLETTLNSIPPTAEELAEEDVIGTQLKALDCQARAKVLLLRTLENPEAGATSYSDTRLKKILENDPAVIYQLDPEFWSVHLNRFPYMNNRQRKAFYKKNKGVDMSI